MDCYKNMKKQKENYLDQIPKHNCLFPYEELANGHIEVCVHNRGFFNRIAQLFFKRPRYSRIELDDMGSFIWKQIDGERSIYAIGQLVEAAYEEKASPLYERLSKYIRILCKNHFILFADKL